MKLKQVFFSFFTLSLLFLLALGSSSAVLAQGITPSATREPLYKTPTIAPTLDYSCPSGTPIGYGTVTPNSALWSAACDHCVNTPVVTGTPEPFLYGLTQTAISAGTPLPPICVTPFGGGQEQCNTSTPGVPSSTVTAFPSVTPSSTQSLDCGGFITGSSWDNFGGIFQVIENHSTSNYVDFTAGFSSTCDSSSWGYMGASFGGIGVSENFYACVTLVSSTNYTDQGLGWSIYNSSGLPLDGSTVGMGQYGSYVQWAGHGVVYGACSVVVRFEAAKTLNGLTNCLYTPTPIPDVTPTPSLGYCAVVPPGGGGSGGGGDLPNIWLGETTCVTTPGMSISLSSISWLPGMSGLSGVSLAMPEINFCVREIFFPTVNIFGLSISLDILSTVVSAGLAIRWLFRS